MAESQAVKEDINPVAAILVSTFARLDVHKLDPSPPEKSERHHKGSSPPQKPIQYWCRRPRPVNGCPRFTPPAPPPAPQLPPLRCGPARPELQIGELSRSIPPPSDMHVPDIATK